MTDVAAAAGVSLKTVSRYVNGETNIDPAIATRIGEAIAALHFRRNQAAASIRPGQRSQLVGLIIEDVANPFYAVLMHSVELALRAKGLLLLTASSEEDPAQYRRLVEQLIERRVDGLIVFTPSDPGPSWPDLAREIPALVVLDRFDPAIEADSVTADDQGGGRDATSLLISGGARRIAFVGEALALQSIAGRHRGYQQALEAASLMADQDLVLDGLRTADQVCAAVTSLLLQDSTIDGFFAANNLASIGVLRALRDLQMSRPIVGFDDFEAAGLVEPGITVVSHSVADMGALAVQLLLDRIEGERGPARRLVLPTTITLRGSHRTAPSP
jgi:LacI family transcriptional regulator